MKILLIRRVEGHSMEPSLKAGKVVIASGLVSAKPGSIVVARVDGLDIVKRVLSIEGDELVITGDNRNHSKQYRLNKNNIEGVVIL